MGLKRKWVVVEGAKTYFSQRVILRNNNINFGIPFWRNNFINKIDNLNIIRNLFIARLCFIGLLRFVIIIIIVRIVILKTIFELQQ
jgi:hypothetical protein